MKRKARLLQQRSELAFGRREGAAAGLDQFSDSAGASQRLLQLMQFLPHQLCKPGITTEVTDALTVEAKAELVISPVAAALFADRTLP